MPKRRRGSRSFPMRPASRHQRFDRLVDRAVARIPEPFHAALEEIALVIDDEPSPEQLRENGLAADETLYGLYEGVPLDEWGGDWVPVPTRIVLFRLPLEEDFPGLADLALTSHSHLGIGDLQWARLEPWREAIAQFFEPKDRRGYMAGIAELGID